MKATSSFLRTPKESRSKLEAQMTGMDKTGCKWFKERNEIEILHYQTRTELLRGSENIVQTRTVYVGHFMSYRVVFVHIFFIMQMSN